MRLLFLLILRRYEGTARLPRTEFFFWKHQFSAILSYIQTHYQEATLEKVAEKFSYSPKQVGRIVKRLHRRSLWGCDPRHENEKSSGAAPGSQVSAGAGRAAGGFCHHQQLLSLV